LGFYSRKTGRYSEDVEKADRMTPAELVLHLKKRALQLAAVGAGAPRACIGCGEAVSGKHRTCGTCFWKAKRMAKRTKDGWGRKQQEKAAKASILPAKNRRKSKIIDSLMGKPPSSKPEPKKPKTIRHQSLDSAILNKKLEEF